MIGSLDKSLQDLNDCGCCEDGSSSLPIERYNRPGLSAIEYRIGTHATFKNQMIDRLSSSQFPQLQSLKVRDDSDFAIALLDAWSMSLDVLTFYQERIANESFLRTATEQRSIYYLASLIDYSPRPGVAASTYVAIEMESAAGAPVESKVPVSTKMQSIPGPGEKPQFFETIEEITARPEWNSISPLLAEKQLVLAVMPMTLLEGVGFNIEIGDEILVVEDENGDSWKFNRVSSSLVDNEKNTTSLEFIAEIATPAPFVFFYAQVATFVATPMTMSNSVISSNILTSTWSTPNLLALSATQKWSLSTLSTNILSQISIPEEPGRTGVFSVSQRTGVFGHNAPQWSSLSSVQRYGERITNSSNVTVAVAAAYPSSANWDSPTPTLLTESKSNNYLHLDAVYDGIGIGSWIVLKNSNNLTRLYKVSAVSEVSRVNFSISAKVTRLTLDSNQDLSLFNIRNTSVFVMNAKALKLAKLPIKDTVPASEKNSDKLFVATGGKNNSVILDKFDLNLKSGQKIVLSGMNMNLDGVVESEILTIDEVIFSNGFTELIFKEGMRNIYQRDTVSINANVVMVTHGESRQEILGNGDSAFPFQAFKLKQPPLTYVSAQTPSGAKATLEIRANSILWSETTQFRRHSPTDQVYIVRTNNEGETTVHFGDGINGARLPTGTENITAQYRQGMGQEGLLKKDQLALLISKPLGVKGVTNPIATSGAEDRESRDQARRNAPFTVLTLDRIVSLQDYEDFSQAFAGVTKSLVTWTWDGKTRGVFVTVSGPNGESIEEISATHINLVAAIKQYSDPLVPVWVKSYRPAFFIVEGKVKIDSQYERDLVLEQARVLLRDRFSFEARKFGQKVNRSEVVAAIQNINGVVGVKLETLERIDGSGNLLSMTPRPGTDELIAAELLTLDGRPVVLEAME